MRRNEPLHRAVSEEDKESKGDTNLPHSLDEASEANAKVRDLDIILSKLSTYKPDLSNGRADLGNQGNA